MGIRQVAVIGLDAMGAELDQARWNGRKGRRGSCDDGQDSPPAPANALAFHPDGSGL